MIFVSTAISRLRVSQENYSSLSADLVLNLLKFKAALLHHMFETCISRYKEIILNLKFLNSLPQPIRIILFNRSCHSTIEVYV